METSSQPPNPLLKESRVSAWGWKYISAEREREREIGRRSREIMIRARERLSSVFGCARVASERATSIASGEEAIETPILPAVENKRETLLTDLVSEASLLMIARGVKRYS